MRSDITSLPQQKAAALRVRRAEAIDIAQVIALDAKITKLAKHDYWNEIYRRHSTQRTGEQFFLVAEQERSGSAPLVVGFMIGEIRAWEFGSEPCGWVFALSVEPKARLHGVGKALLTALTTEFKRAGVTKMRTMVARDAQLPLLFFRSEGMIAGRYLQLEKDID